MADESDGPPGAFPSRLDGFRIVVSQALAGGRIAVKQGGTIHVSPAMWSLMEGATPEELGRLLGSIRLMEIPTSEEWLRELSRTPMRACKDEWFRQARRTDDGA